MIEFSVQILLNQVKCNLDSSLIDTKHFKIIHDDLNLVEDVIQPTIMIFEKQLVSQKIKLEFSSKNISHYYAKIDKLRLQQVLINLIQNSIKFSRSMGKIKLTVKAIHIEEEQFQNLIYHINVEDNGIGMSEEDAA